MLSSFFLLLFSFYSHATILLPTECELRLLQLPCASAILTPSELRVLTRARDKALQHNPRLGIVIAAILEDTSTPVIHRLVKAMLYLKREEMMHSFDYTFPERGNTLLTQEEIDYLIRNSGAHYQLAGRTSEEITQFYANSLRKIFLDLEIFFRRMLAQSFLLQAGLPNQSNAVIKMLAYRLERINNSFSSLGERSTGYASTVQVISNYTSISRDYVLGLVAAFNLFRVYGWATAQQILQLHGFSSREVEQIKFEWSTPTPNRCCVSSPGCRTCPNNRAFLVRNP